MSSKEDKEAVDKLIESSNAQSDKVGEKEYIMERLLEENVDLRGTCFFLIIAVSDLIVNINEAIPLDLKRQQRLDDIVYSLQEIKLAHFADFLDESELNEDA